MGIVPLGDLSNFYFVIEQGIADPTPIGDFANARKSYHRNIDIYDEWFEAPEAHILVVDDIMLNLSVVKGLLKKTGINIDTAVSGTEAIKKLRSTVYDLVFLDHMMPDMDGIETLTRIMEDKDIDISATPIIALTANAISGAQKMYIESGFTDYLSKPINPLQLENLIIKYLPEDKVKKRTRSPKQQNSDFS